MTSKKLVDVDKVLSGEIVGVDRLDRDLKFGDFVMFTEDCKGRSEICFGEVICKRRGFIQVKRMNQGSRAFNKTLKECLDDVANNRGWYTGLAAKSITKVSPTFIAMWDEGSLFVI